MAHPKAARPTLAVVRTRAREHAIEIAAEREASILVGAQHLHDAAQRLDRIAAEEKTLPDSSRR